MSDLEPVRWGILACGNIANAFAAAVNETGSSVLHAVASRDVDKAQAFAQKHGLKIGTISDLIAYRRRNDNLVSVVEQATITSEFGGEWDMRVYTDTTHGDEHVVLSKGDLSGDDPVLVRMHSLDPMLDMIGTGPKGRAFEFSQSMKINTLDR